MNLKLKRTPGLYLVGFMASGKSTVGRHLAHRMGWSFFDLDSEIEAAEKMTIAEIFAGRGEAAFRRIETEMLRSHVRWVERGLPAVLALGGGAFTVDSNRALLAENGITLWLDCPFDIVCRRIAAQTDGPTRPLAQDREKFTALYEARRSLYELADARVEITSDDPEQTVSAILSHPRLK